MLEVYGAQWCTYCKKLKDYLDTNKIEHDFIDIDIDIEESVVLLDMNLTTIPQVFEGDGKLIGGHDDTIEYLESLKALRKDLEK